LYAGMPGIEPQLCTVFRTSRRISLRLRIT
jgi:hypothetical protein